MNSKLKALAITAGFGVWAVAIAFGLQYLSRIVSPDQFVMALAVTGVSVCFYVIYSMILSYIEFNDKLKDMVDRK